MSFGASPLNRGSPCECTGWEPPVATGNPEVVWPLLNIGGLGRAWAAVSSAWFNFATWSYANVALSALPGASLALGGDFMRFSQLDCFLAETMVPWNQLFPHILVYRKIYYGKKLFPFITHGNYRKTAYVSLMENIIVNSILILFYNIFIGYITHLFCKVLTAKWGITNMVLNT